MSRGLVPTFPRVVWTVLAGDALSSIGTGLTLPFLVVYLHRVRGIALEPAVLAVSVLALAGFVGNPIGGLFSDRFGARNALIGGLVVSALGAGALALVRVAWEGLAAAAVVGLGAAVVWPAQDALLASVVGAAHRAGAFSLRYATMNAALGAGALVCGGARRCALLGELRMGLRVGRGLVLGLRSDPVARRVGPQRVCERGARLRAPLAAIA